MLTSPNINYGGCKWRMHDEYKSSVATEPKCWGGDAPFGFDSLDAPDCMPAGSTECYQPQSIPGVYWDMPTTFGRAQ